MYSNDIVLGVAAALLIGFGAGIVISAFLFYQWYRQLRGNS